MIPLNYVVYCNDNGRFCSYISRKVLNDTEELQYFDEGIADITNRIDIIFLLPTNKEKHKMKRRQFHVETTLINTPHRTK